MKKGIFIILALVLLTACGGVSEKGNWNDADKQSAQDAVAALDGQLDALGEQKQPYIDCYLEKVEANYRCFEDANKDLAGCEKLALECVDEITEAMGGDSEIGNWSDEDRQQMADILEEIDSDLESLGEDKEAFKECYASKLENNYKSFAAADNDVDGCESLSEECLDDLGYE